jgi:spore maturation protein CgeB
MYLNESIIIHFLSEQEAIASASQRRMLRDHTYYHRMQELVEIVRKYL